MPTSFAPHTTSLAKSRIYRGPSTGDHSPETIDSTKPIQPPSLLGAPIAWLASKPPKRQLR